MKPLWNHQKYALDKYKDRKFFGLLFPTGTGKTKTSIVIAEEKDKPVIIIAPNALCKQWEEELHNEDNCNKDWDVLVCTSKERTKKGFQEKLDSFCETL